jgi:hypothetical protein
MTVGIYSQNASFYADAGMPAFPVDTRDKRPAVKGWQGATPGKARGWARNTRLGQSNGLGIVMGKPSGITEVDVDAVGDAWLSAAVERFGDTPIIIRTASGKAKLWYRHNGEGRHIRPFTGQPIDVLGAGYTIAPPSWRDDLGASYRFIRGGLEDLGRLPIISSVPRTFTRAPQSIQPGERNDSLWRYCMAQARHCDDVEALIDVAVTWGSAMPEPLSHAEAEQCARNAWAYEASGRNYLGLKKPQLNEGDITMDELVDDPEAFTLYLMFKRWHSNRQHFAIAPTAMSEAGSPPWHRTRIARARDVLLDRGFIVELSAPDKRLRKSGLYRLTLPDHGNNHNTFLPPSFGEVVGHA